MQIFQYIMSIFNCVGVIIALVNLILLKKTFNASHERTCKQATIDFYHELKKQSVDIEQILFINYNHGTVPIDYDQITDDFKFKIKSYLSLLEQFSTGVNLGVYDKVVVYRLSGTFLINTYLQLKPYIKAIRRERNETILYIEFEKLVIDLQNINFKPLTVGGEIKYSNQNN